MSVSMSRDRKAEKLESRKCFRLGVVEEDAGRPENE